MPATTPNQNYPYPLDSDLVDVAGDIENLAKAVDFDVQAVEVLAAGKVNKTGDTMTGMLSLPSTAPTSLNHAITKGWAEGQYLNKTGDTMTGILNMGNHRITGLASPTGDSDAARKSYVEAVFADAVKKSVETRQTVQGQIFAEAFIIRETEPGGPQHAVSRQYLNERLSDVDVSNKVDKSGDTMTGPLYLGGLWSAEEAGMVIRPQGLIRSTVIENADGANMTLNRSAGAQANAGIFINFAHDVDAYVGAIRFETDNTNGIDYVDLCDYRMKEEVGPITDAAERVQALARKAYRGRWKGGGAERDFLNAHDIAEAAPYLVHGDKDGPEMQTADKSKLIPLLVAALGNALDRIDALEARLA
jgi:hypothetical protein